MLCVYIEDSCIKIIVLVRLIVKQCYFYYSLFFIINCHADSTADLPRIYNHTILQLLPIKL